jgi:hypothetical protein
MKKVIFSTITVIALSTTSVFGNYGLIKAVIVKITKSVKPSPKYRQTALENSPKKKGGWIKDPYSGRNCRKKDAHADHIWPKSKGGSNYSWNLVMSCAQDNIRKSDKIGIETIQGYAAKIQHVIAR